jgi:serine/threonine protein kinase/tetratricopeptide (TPR) repeat protein
MKCPKCSFENSDSARFCGGCAVPLRPSDTPSPSQTKTIETSSRTLKKETIFAGKYRVLEELGRGGMGIVYKAEDLKLKRPVALKVLPQEAVPDSEARDRLFLEAQAAAGLSHPNICTIHEVDEVEGKPYIAMEYVEGQSLKNKIRCEIPLSVKEILAIALEVAGGLEEAHKKGIVHRDIKTANVMLTEKGQAKIMDFGLAKFRGGGSLTREGTVLGTVAYMSPEQARGEPLDERTDIWSLGVVLYELLTCQLPFPGDSDQAITYGILNRGMPSPVKWRTDVPRGLVGIIERCLEKNRADRYPSVAALKADLMRLKEGKPDRPGLRHWIASTLPLAAGLVAIVATLVQYYPAIRNFVTSLVNPLPENKSIAFLPFTGAGGEAADQAFCLGLTADLAEALARLESPQGRFWVVPMSDVAAGVKGPGDAQKALNVNLVVTGSLERVKGVRKITVNLFKTVPPPPRRIRSNSVMLRGDKSRALLEPIVNDVLGMLRLKIQTKVRGDLAAGQTSVPEAYEYYAQGRGHLEIYRAKGGATELDTAVELFTRTIDKTPSYALAYAWLAEACREQYELTNAAAWIEKADASGRRALQIEPRLALPHITLGKINNKTGRYEDAIEEFGHAMSLDPRNFEASIERAVAYEGANKPRDAEEAYAQSIRLKPAYWMGYSYLGFFYYQRGRYGEAEKMFLRSVDLSPDNYNGYNSLGGICLATGRTEQARVWFEKSLSIDPNAAAYSNLATIFFNQGKYLLASQAYEKAVQLNSSDVRVLGNLAECYLYTPGGSEKAKAAYGNAIRAATGILKINPRNAETRGRLASFYACTGDFNRALAEIDAARKLAPDNLIVLRKSVLVYELAGRRSRALEALRELVNRGAPLEELETNPAIADLFKGTTAQKRGP